MLQQHRPGLHKTITTSVGICLTNGETVGLDYERRDKTGKTPPVQAWSFLIGDRLHRPHKYTNLARTLLADNYLPSSLWIFS